MRILLLTVGDETVASSRVRVYGYTPFFAERGIKYKILNYAHPAKTRRVIDQKRDSVSQALFNFIYKAYTVARLLVLAKGYEIIFMQKVLLPRPVIKILKGINRNIVFDFDDAIYLERDISYLLESASCVIVSNSCLKEYALRYNEKVHELISPVNAESRPLAEGDSAVRLGWIGSPETSKYLNPIVSAFEKLLEKFENLNMIFMGTRKGDRFISPRIRALDWSIEGEKKFLEEIDVGIMPMEENEWSRAKAGYKLLLYMSRGIPCVASPVGVNNEIIKDGFNGYLAATPEEWHDKLSLLIKDASLRRRIGQEGLNCAEKFYSYRINAPRLINILKKCYTQTDVSPKEEMDGKS